MADFTLARRMVVLAFVGVATAMLASCAGAQRSQAGSVTQMVAGTRIEVLYHRPVARGRSLFGALVPWGRIWTPSADSAARFSISGPVIVNGSALPAGTYGVWTIPDSTEWTIIFNGQADAFHLRYPEGKDVLRIKAVPLRGEHVETLQFAFPVVDADSTVLQLRWGTTVVPLAVRAVH